MCPWLTTGKKGDCNKAFEEHKDFRINCRYRKLCGAVICGKTQKAQNINVDRHINGRRPCRICGAIICGARYSKIPMRNHINRAHRRRLFSPKLIERFVMAEEHG